MMKTKSPYVLGVAVALSALISIPPTAGRPRRMQASAQVKFPA
jgi:hypothetical protein